MKKLRTLFVLTLLFSLFTLPTSVHPQVDSSVDTRQEVSVQVPSVVRLQPPARRTVTIERTDGESISKTKRWGVVSNAVDGAELTLSARPFVNRSDGSVTRPARLKLTKRSGHRWTVTKASGTTGTSGAPASVKAESDGPGNASFDVSVEFIKHPNASKRVSGTFTTTVTGTIRKK